MRALSETKDCRLKLVMQAKRLDEAMRPIQRPPSKRSVTDDGQSRNIV